MTTRRVLLAIFIILIMFVYAVGVYANNTVLQLVPEDSAGFVYMGNPMRLSQKIDELASDMSNKTQHNLLAKKLADAFGADFQNFDELYNNGFDLKKDFCISSFYQNSEEIAVIAHVHDYDGVKALLQEKVGPMEEMKYEGIEYLLGNKSAFAIFDNLFVMARSEDICKKIIDTYQKKSYSILQSSNYQSLKIELSEKNELAVFVNFSSVSQTYSSKLQELKQKTEKTLKGMPQIEQQKRPAEGSKLMLNFGLGLIEQLDLYCLTANLEYSTAKLTGFAKFKDESEIQHLISTEPAELNLLKLLPHGSFLASGGILKKDDWVNLSSMMFDMTQEDVEIESQIFQKFVDELKEFHSHFEEEFAFAVDISYSMVPNLLYIYETEDDASLAEYMKTDYLEYLKLVSSIMGIKALADTTLGETETYNGVEIQRINLPNMEKAFADMKEEMKPLTPKNWSIWYAIKNGKMVLSMSNSSELLKRVLDVINRKAENVESDRNYDRLSRSIATENNFVAYFSPAILIKRIVMLVSQTNPDVGGMFAMMFNNLPESYNIVISGINRDKGIEFDTTVELEDLKQLIQMLLAVNK